ncbi:unnamed protein product [Auanema sp. JU1783]|nr:unnamed protein product [Auanema sp. JU1783]
MKVQDLDAVATDVFGEIRKKRDKIKTGFAEVLLVAEWMQDMEDEVIEFDSSRWNSGINVVEQKAIEIFECCHQLKLICKGFNFVDELKCVIGIMKTRSQ